MDKNKGKIIGLTKNQKIISCNGNVNKRSASVMCDTTIAYVNYIWDKK